MAKKNKEARQQIILECTEQKTSGIPGMSRYISTKNRKNTPERLELKKFSCRYCILHMPFLYYLHFLLKLSYYIELLAKMQ
jgi:large subunit ribosomal protein L33